ncbi:MAG: hypothetical protein EA409_05590 [Saprospirales bacterium]|nr:MAG: hypothetical protein EA409_05590 [Saprospirales bacterium]
MKKILLAALILIVTLNVNYAQGECNQFFPFEHFKSMTYATYDQRDRLQGRQSWEVVDLERSNGAVVATVSSMMYDENEEEILETIFTARCENETFFISMESYHLQGLSESFGRDVEMEISGDDLSLPNKLSEGTSLPDASMEVRVTSPIPLTMNVEITDRLVEGREEVTTPAGTFDAYKISQNSTVRAVIRMRSSSIEYYSPRFGMVRSEDYNRRGRLQGYTVLEQVVER